MLLGVFYWHWRVYALYTSMTEIRRKFAYTEFAFQFQSPWLSRQFGGPMFRDALSQEQQTQVARAERQMRRVMGVVAVCCAIGVLMFAWDIIPYVPRLGAATMSSGEDSGLFERFVEVLLPAAISDDHFRSLFR